LNFVSIIQMIGCRDLLVTYYSHDIVRVKRFPVQRPDWRFTYCSGFSLRIPNTLTLAYIFSFQCFNCNLLFKGTI